MNSQFEWYVFSATHLTFLEMLTDQGVYFMTVALLPMLRAAESPNVTVIASIAGLANQRYVPLLSPFSTNCSSSSFPSFPFDLFTSSLLPSILYRFSSLLFPFQTPSPFSPRNQNESPKTCSYPFCPFSQPDSQIVSVFLVNLFRPVHLHLLILQCLLSKLSQICLPHPPISVCTPP
jgi:hypothetical protein